MENLADILAQIKAETAGKTIDMPAFESVRIGAGAPRDNRTLDEASLSKNLDYIRTHNRVTPFMPLHGSLPVVFVKRVLRKLMRFQVGPTVEEQNDINENMAGIVLYLSGKVSELQEKVADLEAAQGREEGEKKA